MQLIKFPKFLNYGGFTVDIIKFLLILFIFAEFINEASSQEENPILPPTNYDCFYRNIEKDLSEIADRMIILGKDKIYRLDFGKKDETYRFMSEVASQKLASFNTVSVIDSVTDYTIRFSNRVFYTRYPSVHSESVLGDKYITRILYLAFRCIIESQNGDIVYEKDFSSRYSDTFLFDNLEYAERNNYSFMKAKAPEGEIIDKYAVPVTAILVSALAVILFFTVRTK